MKLQQLIEIIETIAPKSLAESWDNVGLLAGDKEREITNGVLCLDITDKAYQMCREKNAGICICHHPFLFDPIKKMDFADPYFALLRKFIQADIAIYAAHTNLDACVGGVNDALGEKLDLRAEATFIPSGVPFDFQKEVVSGIGRICVQKKETSLFDFYHTIRQKLQTSGCHINFDRDRPIRRILITGGAYDSIWNTDVLDNGIDVVLSGEIKHRDMVFFDRYGVAAIAAGHDATERVVLPVLAERLNRLGDVRFDVCSSSKNVMIQGLL